MRRFRILLGLILSCLVSGAAPAAETVIRHPDVGDPDGRNEYQVELLRAVLDATVEDLGPYRMQAVAEMPQAREILSLENGNLHDVLWTVTDAEREQRMRPIRVPLLRGLLGHRVCLVRRDDPLFGQGEPPDREALVIGQAVTWPDARIIAANGFVLEVGSDYQSTLRMLRAGRTNCFPRGLSEIDIELAAYGSDDLRVEDQLSFLYLAPMYFFVPPHREDLAERIDDGLRRLRASGKFGEIHDRHFDTAALLRRYAMASRRAFCLANPDLDAATVEALRPYLISGPGTFASACVEAADAGKADR